MEEGELVVGKGRRRKGWSAAMCGHRAASLSR